MCIYGNIIKNEMRLNLKKNNYISIPESLKLENKDNGLFALGLLANNLKNIGIETLIDLNENGNKEEIDEAITSLQFILNGL
jgi:hypothetical protein